jgi:hypothetical protein
MRTTRPCDRFVLTTATGRVSAGVVGCVVVVVSDGETPVSARPQ